MNKSAMFKAAHGLAKSAKVVVGDYKIALSLALKALYKTGGSFAKSLAMVCGVAMVAPKGDKKLFTAWNRESAELFIESNNIKAGKIWQDGQFYFYVYQ
ncbi:TPA: hypothetical protein ACVU1H_000173 [Vibrio cholerae]